MMVVDEAPAVTGHVGITGFVPLANLALDQQLMLTVRASGIDDDWAKHLAELLRPELDQAGLPEEQLPQLDPIDVVIVNGNKRTVAHGFHRVRAYQLAKRTLIPASVSEGDGEHLLTLALRGNVKNGKQWPVAERKLTLRVLFGDERYNKKPFSWYAQRVGLHGTTVSNEWHDLYPGMEERVVVGADGTAQTHQIGPGSRGRKAPVVVPVVEGELDELYVNGEATGVQAQSMPTPMGNGHSPIPVAQTTRVAPQAVGMANGAPRALPNGYSAPSPTDMSSQYIQVRRPPVIHPTQTLTSFTLYYQLADGTQAELDTEALAANQYPASLPGAVRQVLIMILNGGVA